MRFRKKCLYTGLTFAAIVTFVLLGICFIISLSLLVFMELTLSPVLFLISFIMDYNLMFYFSRKLYY